MESTKKYRISSFGSCHDSYWFSCYVSKKNRSKNRCHCPKCITKNYYYSSSYNILLRNCWHRDRFYVSTYRNMHWCFPIYGHVASRCHCEYISGNLLNVVFSSVDFWQLPLRLLGFRADATTVNLTAGSIGTIVGIALAATFDAVFVGIAVFVIGMSGVIFALLVGLAMLLLSIRLFIFFLSTYIKIILALIFAPLQLVMGAVPGNDAFGSWFKNLIANILIFPASAAMFLLASVFMQLSNSSVDRLWAPPYVGLTSYSATSIGALVAIPNIGKQIQEAFKSKGGMQAGLGGVASVFTQPVQLLMQGYQFYTSHETMKAFRKKDDKHA